jgi:hypothetical protein
VLKPEVRAQGTEAWEAQVRQRMELSLRPRALRPDRIVFVDALPSTPSGKIKRNELLQLAMTGGDFLHQGLAADQEPHHDRGASSQGSRAGAPDAGVAVAARED